MTPSKAGLKLEAGMKVLVFDHRLFKDDLSTPHSVTMQAATVLKRYRKGGVDLVDIRFDRDGLVSRSHFAESVKHLV